MHLPLLCECQKHDLFISHQDMDTSYVVWIFPSDKKEVTFLRLSKLLELQYKGKTFEEWLREKPYIECCKMVSRDLLKALRRKPDYVAIVAEQDSSMGQLTCQQCMGELLSLAGAAISVDAVKALAEGGDGNLIGRKLTELFQNLENKHFLSKQPTLIC